MKKLLVVLCLISVLMLNSCATIMHGKVTPEQKTKPKPGEPQRQIMVGYFVLDLLCFVWPLAVDFGTGAIYKRTSPESPKADGNNK